MKKIITFGEKITIIVTSVVVLLLIAILAFVATKIFSSLSVHEELTIPDTNGEDNYELVTMTTSDIVTAEEKNTMLMFGIGGEGEPSLVDEKTLVGQDQDMRRISASEFSGVLTLQATKVASDTLSLTVKSEVSEGNLAIIVIVDGALYQSIDVNGTQTVSLSDVAGKNVLLRIAGESAKIKVEVRREY